MPCSRENLHAGLAAFGACLEDEYGRPFAFWAEARTWSDLQKQQIARMFDALIVAPIADVAAASPEDAAARETGARAVRVLSDEKIAGRDWEGSWQWELLAAIDNATKAETGGMVTPADPRMLVLRTRYRSDFFTLLAAHLAEHLCGRALVRLFSLEPAEPPSSADPMPDAAVERAAALRHIPGLEIASPEVVAGLLLVIDRLGAKAFCAWCEDFC